MLSQLNTLKNLYRKIIPPKKTYILTEKILKQDIAHCSSYGFAVPYNADKFSLVRVENKSKPWDKRTITSFYDNNEKLIKRYIYDARQGTKERTYSYDCANLRRRGKNNAAINIRNTVTKILEGKNSKLKVKDETFYILHNKNRKNPDSTQHPIKLSSQVSKYEYTKGGVKIESAITEYPETLNREPKSAKKSISATIEIPDTYTCADAVVTNVKKTPNLSPNLSPKVSALHDDKFLAARFLLGEEKIKFLTKYFLKQKNLERLAVKVELNPHKAENAAAAFCVRDRAIYWKRVPKNLRAEDIAAHEAEHAHQFAQIGRYEKQFSLPATAYEQDCARVFGPLKAEEIPEAKRYYIASNEYPDAKMPNYEALHDANYLEQKAEQAGQKAMKAYSKGREMLKNLFKFIPERGDIF